jgi:hypothetical protein
MIQQLFRPIPENNDPRSHTKKHEGQVFLGETSSLFLEYFDSELASYSAKGVLLMTKRTYTGTEIGMLFGIFIGGGIAILLFTSTGNALSFTAVGVGLVIGLILGAGWKRREVE